MTGVFLHVNVCVWSHHPETERRSTRPAAQWAACHYSLLRLTLPAQTLSSQHISNQHLLLSSHLFPNSVWWSDRLHFLLNYCHCFLFFFWFFFKGVCTTHVLPVLEKALHMQIHWQEKTAVTYKKQTQENKIEISVLQIIVKSGLLLYTHLSRTWTNLFWRGTGVPHVIHSSFLRQLKEQ